MDPIRRPLDPNTGAPVTLKDVVEFFHQCPKCNGWLDKRDRDAVLRHEQEGEIATDTAPSGANVYSLVRV